MRNTRNGKQMRGKGHFLNRIMTIALLLLFIWVNGNTALAQTPAAAMTEASGANQQILYLDVELVDCTSADAFALRLEYDEDVLEYMTDLCSFSKEGTIQYFDLQKGTALWSVKEPMDISGNFVELAFRIREDAPAGVSAIKAAVKIKQNGESVLETDTETKITINCEHEWDEGIQISDNLMVYNCMKCSATMSREQENTNVPVTPGGEGNGEEQNGENPPEESTPGTNRPDQDRPGQAKPGQGQTGQTGQTKPGQEQTGQTGQTGQIGQTEQPENNSAGIGEGQENIPVIQPEIVENRGEGMARPGESQWGNGGSVTGSLSYNSIVQSGPMNQNGAQQEAEAYLAQKRQEQLESQLGGGREQLIRETQSLMAEVAGQNTQIQEVVNNSVAVNEADSAETNSDKGMEESISSTVETEQTQEQTAVENQSPEAVQAADSDAQQEKKNYAIILTALGVLTVVTLGCVLIVLKGEHFSKKTEKK